MKLIKEKEVFESIIDRDEDTEIFHYGSVINDIWHYKVRAAIDFQKINFDLENNDSLGKKKTIYITKNLRKDQPVKYEINAELCRAGGDWEYPVMYFKVEFHSDYFYGKKPETKTFIWDIKPEYEEKLKKCYVIIPPVEAGNTLIKDKNGYRAYQEEDFETPEIKREASITDDKIKQVWKWLIDTINKYVDDNHESLD
jgi:hypothetical protein